MGSDNPGPVWDETLKAQHIKWGDIIPPFKYSGGNFPGLNWPAGQDIYENGCTPVSPPEEQVFGALEVTKTVVPPPGTPAIALPGSFTVNVKCDDLVTDVDLTFPYAVGTSAPQTVANIEAGSTCVITEKGTEGFDPLTTVTFTPAGANTAGVLVDGNTKVSVNVKNDFGNVAGEVVEVEAAAATAVPAGLPLTG